MRFLIHSLLLWFGLAAVSGAEPVTLPHKYGSTVIHAPPERVVSVSYIGHDFLLALGVVPVGLREWYGNHPYGVWPWAQQALGDAKPVVLKGEIDIEEIARLQPDLIVGQWSGMSEQQYRLLSQIAPTLPPDVGETDYSSSWQKMLRRIGAATGRRDLAEQVVSRLERRFKHLRNTHPDWASKSAVVAWSPSLSAFASQDLRGRFLSNLGFTVPQAIDDLVRGGNFYVPISAETLEPIDTDVLIWLHTGDLEQSLNQIRLRPLMRAVEQRREIAIDAVLSAALSHSSPLSLDFALDQLAPVIAAAADGDPATHARTASARTLGSDGGD